jgi:hypothetical protein
VVLLLPLSCTVKCTSWYHFVWSWMVRMWLMQFIGTSWLHLIPKYLSINLHWISKHVKHENNESACTSSVCPKLRYVSSMAFQRTFNGSLFNMYTVVGYTRATRNELPSYFNLTALSCGVYCSTLLASVVGYLYTKLDICNLFHFLLHNFIVKIINEIVIVKMINTVAKKITKAHSAMVQI